MRAKNIPWPAPSDYFDKLEGENMKNVAVVLGVDKYSTASALPSCQHDAELMESFLSATGKYIVLRLPNDVDKHKALELIDNALTEAGEIGEVLFYFSGHGVQDSDMHYALFDTRIDAINSTALNNAEVDVVVRKASPKLFVKIIDACQSGLSYIKGLDKTITEEMELLTKGLGNCIFLCSSRSTQYSYAGNPYSKFTKAVIDAVDYATTQTVKYSDLQNYLSDSFGKEQGNQTPYFNTQCDGTDVFCEKTPEVIALLQRLKGESQNPSPETSSDANRVAAYLESCRDEQEVHKIMDDAVCLMEKYILNDDLLSAFYDFSCEHSAPYIYHSYREERSIVKMLYNCPISENLFVNIECSSVKQDSILGEWYATYKKEPIAFTPSAKNVPAIRAYHLKARDKHLPDYVIPFVFVYSPTFFYVFTCTKQFLRKGWNEYEESQGTKYTYAKFEYQEYSGGEWLSYLEKRLQQSVEYAKKTLLEFVQQARSN